MSTTALPSRDVRASKHPAARPAAAGVPRRIVAATVAGNALEFYDFVTYAFFAVYIGKAFFPSTSDYGSLLASVATFGVGFLFRPLGGILIGSVIYSLPFAVQP